MRIELWACLLAGLALFKGASNAQNSEENLALNRPVFSSGANFRSLRPDSLTDGTPDTFTSPAAASGTLGFYYQVDLGRVYQLDRIVLRNRGDGCCPERLSRIRVEVFADGGDVVGPLQWSAKIRGDGSNSGVAGVDLVTAGNNPNGNFAGRFVRVVNESDMGYSPQLAEIEVYGGFAPVIRVFTADNDNLSRGQNAVLRWEVAYASGVSIDGVGPVSRDHGEQVVSPSTTTFYTLRATNNSATVTAIVGVGVNAELKPPVLNEILADNATTFEDEDGDPSDWIEIHNPNLFSLPMEGYGLGERPDSATVWRFPAIRIRPGGHLIVFASGKNRRDPAAPLHTHFKLDADGDFVALWGPGGRGLIGQIPADQPASAKYPKLGKNVAYGIGANGGSGFLKPPTPGGPNGPAFGGVVSDTKFSHDRGFYETNFQVRISSATPDALIRFTTNQSRPTATSGQIYTGPIPITRTTVLRAIAFKNGWAPTDVDTHTYVFPSNVIASPLLRTSITTNPEYRPRMKDALLQLPSVSLVASGAVRDDTQVLTSFEWLDPKGVVSEQVDCGVQLFGGAFTDFAKKSFRLYFKSEFGPPQLELPVYDEHGRDWAPARSFDQLELRSGSHDMQMRGFYMSNLFADDTLLDLGQLAPHGRWVHLYLNGDYWGVFHLRERWGASMHRDYLGGSVNQYESINGNWNVGGWAEPGTPYDGDGTTWALAKSLRNQYANLRAYVDVPNYIDYMLTWIWGRCEDEYRCVGPTVPGSGFKFYVNDADGFFQSPANPWYGEPSNRTLFGAQGRQPGDGPGNLFSSLFRNGGADYRALLADRIHQALFLDGALSPAQTERRLLERCAELELPFLAEAARWNYRTPAQWASIRDDVVKNWIPTRTDEVKRQLRSAGFYPSLDAPTLEHPGGLVASGFKVSFRGPISSSIYFTTDGTDPRLPGGAISSRARRVDLGGISEVLIPTGAVWRWFTDANGLGTSAMVAGQPSWSPSNWKHPEFNDSTWSKGAAQFGYGEGDEATVIPFGPNGSDKWTTSYYRAEFNSRSVEGIRDLELRLKADDGAIVYLNGVELVRAAMTAGPVVGTTKSLAASDDGQSFQSFALPAQALRPGRNLVAVELHQSATNTSDATFDLELKANYVGSAIGEAPVLTRNTLLRARAWNGAQWSAVYNAFFQVRPEPILPGEVAITEIHYHPQGDPGAEFLELTNLSSDAVNLRGCRLAPGVEFQFPERRDLLLAPGERIVLVKDLFEFRRRYGLEIPVAGVYRGSLNNAGEPIALMLPSGAVLASVHYKSEAPWPVQPEGGGHSLVLARPELGWPNPAAWRFSPSWNGSPGTSDPGGFTGNPALDLDGDGWSAWVEYALGSRDDDASSGPGSLKYGVGSLGEFFVSFPRNPQAFDAILRVEVSRDLSSWEPAHRLGVESNEATGLLMERWGIPGPLDQTVFLRVQVAR